MKYLVSSAVHRLHDGLLEALVGVARRVEVHAPGKPGVGGKLAFLRRMEQPC